MLPRKGCLSGQNTPDLGHLYFTTRETEARRESSGRAGNEPGLTPLGSWVHSASQSGAAGAGRGVAELKDLCPEIKQASWPYFPIWRMGCWAGGGGMQITPRGRPPSQSAQATPQATEGPNVSLSRSL